MRRIVVLVKDGDLQIAEVRGLLYDYLNDQLPGDVAGADYETISIPLKGSLQDIIEKAEHEAIAEFYHRLQGNKIALAKILGIGRTTLWRKLNSMGIE